MWIPLFSVVTLFEYLSQQFCYRLSELQSDHTCYRKLIQLIYSHWDIKPLAALFFVMIDVIMPILKHY